MHGKDLHNLYELAILARLALPGMCWHYLTLNGTDGYRLVWAIAGWAGTDWHRMALSAAADTGWQ